MGKIKNSTGTFYYTINVFCLPQVFSTNIKSQSKPETTGQSKPAKAPLSLFDDEDEEVKIFPHKLK